MSQLVFSLGFTMRLNGLHKSIFNISLVGIFWGGLCASSWGNVKSFFENVLLAGEMLKSEKPTVNISPVEAFFFGGGRVVCFWLGKCYIFF